MEFKSIFTPLKIGNMVLKNRLVIPGMGNNLGSEDGAGDMTPKAQAYYAERKEGKNEHMEKVGGSSSGFRPAAKRLCQGTDNAVRNGQL